MDRITETLLNEFIQQNSLEKLPQEDAFEHFAGYLVTSSHYSEVYDTGDIVVGAGGDTGIDSITIIVNGTLVTEPDEIEDLSETNGYLDVAFIFAQAERSSSFSTSKIGQFGFGVTDFFDVNPKLTQNTKLGKVRSIWKEILSRSASFKNGNPQCFLYYVTTGRWEDDHDLIVRKEAICTDIKSLGLFRRVVLDCIDASKLQQLYRESKNARTVEILFSKQQAIPEIEGVEQAYLGLLPATEFIKLVENDNHEMLMSVFYDNVRHWQEWNPVNTGMKKTLEGSDRILFPLLNNGVTIVGERINRTGDKFFIEDYQVVNGCQTSFVLHECRAHWDESVMVPVRLIATQDEEIKKAIINATNRQTSIPEEQFFALSEFPRKLEDYFPSFDSHKLYYERRPGQYNGISGLEKVRVINMTVMVRSFASMFLQLPHRTTRNYKALLRMLKDKICHIDHRLEPYYVSAYAHYRLDYLFRSQFLPPELKTARYHLLMAYRLLIDKAELPPMNSNAMERYCKPLIVSLQDDNQYKKIFADAASHVQAVAMNRLDSDNIRTEVFTNSLLDRLSSL